MEFVDSLRLAAEVIFSGSYSVDVKGRLVEKYLITMLELIKRFSFVYKVYFK
jgi:hypothetical protein